MLFRHGLAGLTSAVSGPQPTDYNSPVGDVTPNLVLDFNNGPYYAVDTGSGLTETTQSIITNFSALVTGGGDADGITRLRTTGTDTPEVAFTEFDYVTASGTFLIVGRYDAVAAFDRTFMFNYDANNRIGQRRIPGPIIRSCHINQMRRPALPDPLICNHQTE